MWDVHSMLEKLDEVAQEAAKQNSPTAEVDTALLNAAVQRLRGVEVLESQLEQAQEQLTMKPSVAKKLNERICVLETQLSHTRVASNIAELERKCARMESELRQSHSTKNTLKSGLLDVERRHKDFIYSHKEMEELWGEVLGLLGGGGKDTMPPTAVMQKVKLSIAAGDHLSGSSSKGAQAGTVSPTHEHACDEGARWGVGQHQSAPMPDASRNPATTTACADEGGDEGGDGGAESTGRGAEFGGFDASNPHGLGASPLAQHTGSQEQGVQGGSGNRGAHDEAEMHGWDVLEHEEHDVREGEAAEEAARARQVEARGFAGLF